MNIESTQTCHACFLISFQKFLEELALKRNAAGASSPPNKDKSLRSPSPYVQQPRSPSWCRAVHLECKNDVPVAGELNRYFKNLMISFKSR